MKKTLTNPKKLEKLFGKGAKETKLFGQTVIDLRGSRGEEKDRKQMRMYVEENGGVW